jgi:hypothetical protein
MRLDFQSDPRCFVEYILQLLCYDGPRFISYSPRDSEYLNGDMVVHQPERTRFIMRYDVSSMPLDNICTCAEVFVDQKSQFWREAHEPERLCLVLLRGASRRRHCSPCSVGGAESYRWRDSGRWRERKGFGAVVETLIEVCRWLLSVKCLECAQPWFTFRQSHHNHNTPEISKTLSKYSASIVSKSGDKSFAGAILSSSLVED